MNRRRRPFQGRALPLSYLASVQTSRCNFLRGFRHDRSVRASQGTSAATTLDSIATRRSSRQGGGSGLVCPRGGSPRLFCGSCGAFRLSSGRALRSCHDSKRQSHKEPKARAGFVPPRRGNESELHASPGFHPGLFSLPPYGRHGDTAPLRLIQNSQDKPSP